MSRQTLVLDTNLLVSAFIRPDGAASQALQKALLQFDVAASDETLVEVHEVLNRPKFDRYLSAFQRLQYLRAYREAVVLIEVRTHITDSPDPKDNKFLALALDARATLLVSGDKKDLLALSPYRGVRILSVAEFLAL
ncbi:MAG: putative toxin-antitoxin system toxin component, PIN family [Lautropia sp.]|nr:putative toxin-antitoxin system toxin component, PIN family [Lautropia sp.]